MNPFFTVIIPTFNRETFLCKAVESVLSQSFEDFELIVVDDGSTDGTAEYLDSLKDPRVAVTRQENAGPAAARNAGLRRAKAEWVAFLDSDDRWVKDKLKKTAGAIRANPGIRIFHTEELWYRGGKIHNPQKKHRKPDGRVYSQALPLCCVSISTAVVHRSVFEAVGDFDESLPACEDYDFWLRATHRFEVRLIPEFLTEKDGGRPDQLSLNVWGLDRFRIRSLAKMLKKDTLEGGEREATFRTLKKKCEIFAQGAGKRGRAEDAARYRNLIEQFENTLTITEERS